MNTMILTYVCVIVQADQSGRMKGRVPKSASGFLRRDILEISTNPRQQSIVDQICPVGSRNTSIFPIGFIYDYELSCVFSVSVGGRKILN